MCEPLTLGLLFAAATGGSMVQQHQAQMAQQGASNQAEDNAKKTAAEQDIATNRANQKSPDIATILAGNRAAAGQGGGSTMLTGPGGVANSSLSLGKQTLLGS